MTTDANDAECIGIGFTYEHPDGLTLNFDGRGCPIYLRAGDLDKAFDEALDPMARFDWTTGYRRPRTWRLPSVPDLSVRAVRDCEGRLWLRGITAGIEDDTFWQCQAEGYPLDLHTWHQLLEYTPITDATGELVLGA